MNKRLRSLIDRAERLIAEREEANEGIRDLRKEMKSDGYEATQIMRLAQLSYDDKKRAKLATANETLALYNRESGLGLVLGLGGDPETSPAQTDRAATSSAPEGPAEGEQPPRPEPISESTGGGTPQPDHPTAASAIPPADVPPVDPDDGWQSRDGAAGYELAHRIAGGKGPAGEVDTAKTQAVVAMCQAQSEMPPIPAFLRRA